MRERGFLCVVCRSIVILGAVSVLALSAESRNGLAAAPALLTPAIVTFNNMATGLGVAPGITGDGPLQTSTYSTQNGVTCQIYTGGSQDLTLNLHQSRSKPKRTIRYVYTQLADASLQPSSNVPSGTLVDSSFVNIAKIGNMVVGSIESRPAYFSTAIGSFEANPDRYQHAQWVVVTRTSQTTWVVTTDALDYPLRSGDLSVLLRSGTNTVTPVGLYHLPFELSVSCPTCR